MQENKPGDSQQKRILSDYIFEMFKEMQVNKMGK